MNFEKLLCLLLALVMVVSLCACGGDQIPTGPSTPSTPSNPTDPTNPTNPTDDGLTEYVINIQDQDGNPLAGAFVQICTDLGCMPADNFTGADGKISIRAAENTYKVQINIMPEGYTHADPAVTNYYFASGATEIIIKLAPVVG